MVMASHHNDDADASISKSVDVKLTFPPPGVAYFNNASSTRLPPSVLAAGQRALHSQACPWDAPSHDAQDDLKQIRRLFAKLIGSLCVDGSDVTICPSTAFAITLAAHNLRRTGKIRPNSKILLIQDQMPSAVYPWQEICHFVEGLELLVVPYPETKERGWTELILEQLQDAEQNISVACLPQCHWADGSLIDLVKVSEACQSCNVSLVIDATQSIGAMPFSVQEIDAELVSCSVHKWLLAPHGCSLCYVNPRNHDAWLPLDQHDRARLCNENPLWDVETNKLRSGRIQDGAGYSEEFVHGARRLDAGGRPNPILMPMLRAALEILARYGDIERIQSKISEINDQVLEGAMQMGFTTSPGPRAGHILGLRPGSDELKAKLTPEAMLEICKRLQAKGIFISARCGAFRISPYINTTEDEVKQLLAGLADECCDDEFIKARFAAIDTTGVHVQKGAKGYCSVM